MKKRTMLTVSILLFLLSMLLPVNVLAQVPPAAPAAPSALKATPVGPQQVNLTFQDNSDNEKEFRVERADDASFTIGLVSFNVKSSAGVGNSITVTDGGVRLERTFFYRVFAIDNNKVASVQSETAQVAMFVPAQPTGLVATADGPTQVTLSWVDNATTETSYDVDRSLAADFVVRVSVEFLAPNTTTFVDTTVQPGTTYFYRVQAVSPLGDSPVSNVVSVTTPIPGLPAAPSGLAIRIVSGTQVDLTWSDNATDETSYHLERAADSAFPSAARTHIVLSANATAFSDTTVSAGQTLFYRVHAANAVGDSAFSNTAQVSVVAPVAQQPPAPPAAQQPPAPPAPSLPPAPITPAEPAPSAPSAPAAPTTPSEPAPSAPSPSVPAEPAPSAPLPSIPVIPEAQPAPSAPPATASGLVMSADKMKGLTPSAEIKLDARGIVQNSALVKLESQDPGKLSVAIAPGTRILDAAGAALSSLSVAAMSAPPSAPPHTAIAAAYDIGPDGATFDPPLTLTLGYDPANLPAGVAEADLLMAFWDGSQWVTLQTLVDTETNVASSRVGHFTNFALLAQQQVPALAIVSPSDGADLPQGNLAVTVDVTGFILVPPGAPNAPGQGHIHYYKDVTIPTAPGQPAVTAPGTYQASPSTTVVWQSVPAGAHSFGAQLVNNNHTPLESPVMAVVMVTVTAPAAPPAEQPQSPSASVPSSGAAPVVTVEPEAPPTSSAPAKSSNWVLVGAIVGLVVVGALVGTLIRRRRPA